MINIHLLALTVKGFPLIRIHFDNVLMKSLLHKDSQKPSYCCKFLKFANVYEVLISTIICQRNTVDLLLLVSLKICIFLQNCVLNMEINPITYSTM